MCSIVVGLLLLQVALELFLLEVSAALATNDRGPRVEHLVHLYLLILQTGGQVARPVEMAIPVTIDPHLHH